MGTQAFVSPMLTIYSLHWKEIASQYSVTWLLNYVSGAVDYRTGWGDIDNKTAYEKAQESNLIVPSSTDNMEYTYNEAHLIFVLSDDDEECDFFYAHTNVLRSRLHPYKGCPPPKMVSLWEIKKSLYPHVKSFLKFLTEGTKGTMTAENQMAVRAIALLICNQEWQDKTKVFYNGKENYLLPYLQAWNKLELTYEFSEVLAKEFFSYAFRLVQDKPLSDECSKAFLECHGWEEAISPCDLFKWWVADENIPWDSTGRRLNWSETVFKLYLIANGKRIDLDEGFWTDAVKCTVDKNFPWADLISALGTSRICKDVQNGFGMLLVEFMYARYVEGTLECTQIMLSFHSQFVELKNVQKAEYWRNIKNKGIEFAACLLNSRPYTSLDRSAF